jgi:hypothetical protein
LASHFEAYAAGIFGGHIRGSSLRRLATPALVLPARSLSAQPVLQERGTPMASTAAPVAETLTAAEAAKIHTGHASIRMMELKMTKMSTSPAAERMRRYRQRRRGGVQYIRIPLHVTEIDQLIHSPIGRWKEDDPRTDAEVVQAAILTLVYGTLDRE